jgi:hypothetical protein
VIGPVPENLASWRFLALYLVAKGTPPEDVLWSSEQTLFAEKQATAPENTCGIAVPRDFLQLDEDVRQLQRIAQEVSRDMHKMKAFVRFRHVEGSEPEQFVA